MVETVASAFIALIMMGGQEIDLKIAFPTYQDCQEFKQLQAEADLSDADIYCIAIPGSGRIIEPKLK